MSVSGYQAEFKKMVEGPTAFYRQPDYLQTTQREFAEHEALPPRFQVERDSPFSQFITNLFSYLIFPITLYRWAHVRGGKTILPSTSYPKEEITRLRNTIPLNSDWKFKRFSFEIPMPGSEPYKVDAIIVGKKDTLNNGTWLFRANGNGETGEMNLTDLNSDFYQILTQLNGNGLVFNYPGVGASSGPPSREAMEKAVRMILDILPAKKVIGLGHSMGGGALTAIKDYAFKPDVKYVFVKSRTFADIASSAAIIAHRIFGWIAKLVGWNLDCVAASRSLPHVNEIILQSAAVSQPTILTDHSKMVFDQMIPLETSLGYVLAKEDAPLPPNKVLIGVPEMHNDRLRDTRLLTNEINRLLR